MRSSRFVAAFAIAGALAVACTDLGGLSETADGGAVPPGSSGGDGDAGGDSGTRSTGSLGFVVAPASVDLQPSGNATIKVTLDHAATTPVTFVVNNLGAGATAAPLTIPNGATEGTFVLAVNDKPQYGPAALAVVGTAGEASGTAPLALRVHGSVTFAAGAFDFVVPDNVRSITAKLWGAGGGGAVAAGAVGGGGGFATCAITVTPGETLRIAVGTGGKSSAGSFFQSAGGGGGYTAILRSGAMIVVAGGGGGGGRSGTAGGPGGGGAGGDGLGLAGAGASPTAPGKGGAPPADGGGAPGSDGSGNNGGAGAGDVTSNSALGGSPGGGRGGAFLSNGGVTTVSGGGGGGGGFFGGGGGAGRESPAAGGGGGGGSGHAACDSAVLTPAVGATPGAATDLDYGSGAGVGGPINADGAGGRVFVTFGTL